MTPGAGVVPSGLKTWPVMMSRWPGSVAGAIVPTEETLDGGSGDGGGPEAQRRAAERPSTIADAVLLIAHLLGEDVAPSDSLTGGPPHLSPLPRVRGRGDKRWRGDSAS